VDPQQQSRWRPTRGQLLWAGGIAALAFLLIVTCGYLFGWEWTGLPRRTLWDWLNLLIVPVVLALGGYFFTRSENRRTQQNAEAQRELDRDIAEQRRNDDVLQAYLDQISELLLDQGRPLRASKKGDEVRWLARARTLTAFETLDAQHCRTLILFLSESGLISPRKDDPSIGLREVDEDPVIDLSGADLRGVELSDEFLQGVRMSYVDLRGANLAGANLGDDDLGYGAILRSADLRGAVLIDASLIFTNFAEADLSDADLRYAHLGMADLRKAKLQNADLRGASLEEAALKGANLTGADLTDARGTDRLVVEPLWAPSNHTEPRRFPLEHQSLEQLADSLEGATMPDGQKYEDWLESKGSEEDGENGGPS
jgi:uncharacterized protein YjbI with pentapeptide repeats